LADLVSKYFLEDLNEAEDQALSEVLQNSPEDSLRFEDGLREAYLRYGLPDPQWPGNPNDYPSPQGGIRWKMWFWMMLAAFLAVASGRYLFTKGRNSLRPPAKTPVSHRRPSGVSQPKPHAAYPSGHPAHASALDGEKPQPSFESAQPALSTGPIPPSSVSNAVKAQGALAPANPTKVHKGLEVTVRQAAPGQVTVRVLQADGTQAAFLYQGVLPAGNWVFDWDGKLSGETPAQPGSYRIQVTSGNITREKIVFIRKHGAE